MLPCVLFHVKCLFTVRTVLALAPVARLRNTGNGINGGGKKSDTLSRPSTMGCTQDSDVSLLFPVISSHEYSITTFPCTRYLLQYMPLSELLFIVL